MQLNSSMVTRTERPVKVMQFGEGNFLRAFVDWMIDIGNEKGVFNSNIAIVKPIAFGSLERFDKQDNLYTVELRGMEDGKTVEADRVVTSIAKTIDPFTDYAAYEALCLSEELRFVVSNTTEAGIVFDESDRFELTPPATFPGKLTKLLYQRFQKFSGAADKGLIMIPCELIDNNGAELRRCVLKFVDLWQLGDAFKTWVEQCCIFSSTLVDRIVTGYPREEAAAICQKLGYEDELLDTGEPFSLWVIESEKDFSAEFPLDKAGCHLVFTDNVKPYKERKVRILNGAHTSTVPAAFLAGYDYVIDMMKDETVVKYMKSILFDEIIPTLSLPRDDLEAFAAAVFERFSNPFIKHALQSIALNSVSKYKARVTPSLVAAYQKEGKLPKLLTFSFAALLCYYLGEQKADGYYGSRGGESYRILDDEDVLAFFAEYSAKPSRQLVDAFLASDKFAGPELREIPGFAQAVAQQMDKVKQSSMREALAEIVR